MIILNTRLFWIKIWIEFRSERIYLSLTFFKTQLALYRHVPLITLIQGHSSSIPIQAFQEPLLVAEAAAGRACRPFFRWPKVVATALSVVASHLSGGLLLQVTTGRGLVHKLTIVAYLDTGHGAVFVAKRALCWAGRPLGDEPAIAACNIHAGLFWKRFVLGRASWTWRSSIQSLVPAENVTGHIGVTAA